MGGEGKRGRKGRGRGERGGDGKRKGKRGERGPPVRTFGPPTLAPWSRHWLKLKVMRQVVITRATGMSSFSFLFVL